MCGIVGFAGNLNYEQERAFDTLLVLDTLRGVDATGALSVKRDGVNYNIVKTIGHAFDLLEHPKYKDIKQGFSRVLLGHNRAATVGNITKNNAHPFEMDHILGVHNGTLFNKFSLHQGDRFEVDSQALYNHIAVKGLRDAINTVRGAYALVWYNYEDDTLNFLRNKERPLFIAKVKNKDVIAWASESWMLEVGLKRHEMEIEELEALPVDRHVSYQIGLVNGVVSLGKPIVTPMAQPEVVVNNNTVTNITSYKNRGGQVTVPFGTQKTPGAKEHIEEPGHLKYTGRKNVVLEGIAEMTDSHQARYMTCMDIHYPNKRIRLYLKPSDGIKSLEGKQFTCDIHDSVCRDGTDLYYKAVHSTVRLVKPFNPSNPVIEKEAPEEDSQEEMFPDQHGRLIPRAIWENAYGFCALCDGNTDPKEANRFTKNGEIICAHCVKSEPELVEQFLS